MARSDPDKLAQALRANLRRRKGPKGSEGPQDGHPPPEAPEQPLEKPRPAKG